MTTTRLVERDRFDVRRPRSEVRVDVFHKCGRCGELFATVISLWGHQDVGECPPTREGYRAGLTYTAWEPPSGRHDEVQW